MLLIGSTAVTASISLAAPAEAAPIGGDGSISGTVVDELGNPFEGACVWVENGPSVQTDGAGAFVAPGLAAGDYRIQFSDCRPTPSYITTWYPGQYDANSSTRVTVVDAQDSPLGLIAMIPGVVVQGTVTDSSAQPLAGINVSINTINPPWAGTGLQTQPDGTYRSTPLPAGDYRVSYSDPSYVWANEYWNGQFDQNAAQTLTLDPADGPVRSGVDADLVAAATISGTVTNASGDPIEGACVAASLPSGSSAGWANTLADGTYTMTGVTPTDVRLQFRDCSQHPSYLDVYFGGSTDWNEAQTLSITPGEHRSGVDVTMQTGITISGTVTDTHGDPIAGVNVNVNPFDNGQSGWAQTAADGSYTTSPLPPGDYRVQFTPQGGSPGYAVQFWDDQPSWNTAERLTLTTADLPGRTGVDAVLTDAASISGTVTDSAGSPLGDMCVTAIIETPDGFDGLAQTDTASDGTYTLGGLAAPFDLRVVFEDCHGHGPYSRQLWNASTSLDTAELVHVDPGSVVTGIDAALVEAASISGTVTDADGDPLQQICVQATTDSFAGGLTTTDGDGNYTLSLDRAGDYHVQFVDCTGQIRHAGRWWGTGSRGQTVTVAVGQARTGIDAALEPGSAGSISGTVRNAAGVAMTSACVVAYLPNQFALFAPVEPDGSYTVQNVPSGEFSLAFLGCEGGGEPQPTVKDPVDASIAYPAEWWNGVPLSLAESVNGGPDPIAQGANLVAVGSGAHLTGYDQCFGCLDPEPEPAPEPEPEPQPEPESEPEPVTSIAITSITSADGVLTVSFTSSTNPLTQAATTFTVTCASPSAPTLVATGAGSPITLSPAVAGAVYTCEVDTSSGAASPQVMVAVPTQAAPGIAADDDPQSGVTLPRTGSNPSTTLALAAVLLASGLLLTRLRRHRA